MKLEKIERAKQHLSELKSEISSFLSSQPYKAAVKRDPKTKQIIYYCSGIEEVPEKIALIAGDVIQNLRSALDHLAYKLFLINSSDGTLNRDIYFPIAEDLARSDSKKSRQTSGMSQNAKDLIDSIKPYKGGNDRLWQINELNNTDKHRLLVTVGASLDRVDLGTSISVELQKLVPGVEIPKIPAFFKTAVLSPLKVGDTLLIHPPDKNEIPETKFEFGIIIDEPNVLKTELLVDALQSMIETVDAVIISFDPLLS
ncbi:MAG TPA: hypothetical protein VMR34_01815 [Candidatus Saccharimonadales bacterium]|nr:hypothetical protein [Candidatus Saccharimonadales bacterium]